MHRSFACLLAVAALCITTTGYAQSPLDRSTQFFGNCMSGSNAECDSGKEICQAYVNALDKQPASRAKCRRYCKRLNNRLSQKYVSLRNCNNIITHATDLCEQECLRQHPKR